MSKTSSAQPNRAEPAALTVERPRRAGVVGRAALLEALQVQPLDWFELPGVGLAAGPDASMPGFQRQQEVAPKPRLPEPEPPMRASVPPGGSRRLPLRMPAAWVVTSQRTIDDELPPDPSESFGDGAAGALVPAPRPLKSDALQAIVGQQRQTAQQAWARLGSRLRSALDPLADTPWRQAVDWKAVTARVARGQGLWPLPRRSRPRWPGDCTVLLDALAPSVVPLRDEMDAIASRLRRSIGGAVTVLEFAEHGPQLPLHEWRRDEAAGPKPPMRGKPRRMLLPWQRWHGQTVLLLSDLAGHDRDADRRPNWHVLVNQARDHGIHLQALVPCAAPGLAQLPRALHWAPWPTLQRSQYLPPPDLALRTDNSSRALSPEPVLTTLLALLGLCGDAHTVLLRGLVRLVAPGPPEASWLWRLWNHDDVERLQGGYCRLLEGRADAHLQQVQQLPAALALQAFKLRRTLAASMDEADEHGAVLRAASLAPQMADAIAAEVAAARHFIEHDWPRALREASADQLPRLGVGAAVWVEQALGRIRLDYRQALQRLLALAHAPAMARGEPIKVYAELGPVRPITPDRASMASSYWTVLQHGPNILLRAAAAAPPPPADPFDPVIGLGYGLGTIGPVRSEDGVTVVFGRSARWLALDAAEVTVHDWDGHEAVLRLLFGGVEVELATIRRPRGVIGWASLQNRLQTSFALPWKDAGPLPLVAGSKIGVEGRHLVGIDNVGAYLDLVIAPNVEQRFRYIEPGTFQMGSPESEPGRYSDEGPRHPVTLTQGYWLADTPCTQALWTAVLGKNPSHFKDRPDAPQRPVEQVSWDMVQEFLAALSKHLPAGCAPALPTEAQWEYAARAGTATSYWWGDEADASQANWNREQGGTTVVKRYPANPWGLYDVHGNVWEWCAGSQRQYADREAEDPPDGQNKEVRALRGGAWNRAAGDARSASRIGVHRDLGWREIGFRLVLRSASQGGGAAESPEGGVLAGRGAAGTASGRRSDAGGLSSGSNSGRGRTGAKKKGTKKS